MTHTTNDRRTNNRRSISAQQIHFMDRRVQQSRRELDKLKQQLQEGEIKFIATMVLAGISMLALFAFVTVK